MKDNRMKNTRLLTLLLSLPLALLFSSSILKASDEHGHNHEAAVEPAPHGGILRDALPYKAELVLEKDLAKVFVYDKELKPAKLTSQSIVGKIRFPKDKKEKVVTFVKKGDAYEARVPGIAKAHRYDLHIDVKEGATTTVVDFGIDNIH